MTTPTEPSSADLKAAEKYVANSDFKYIHSVSGRPYFNEKCHDHRSKRDAFLAGRQSLREENEKLCARVKELESALKKARDEADGCAEDRNYYGVYPRHKELVGTLDEVLKGGQIP